MRVIYIYNPHSAQEVSLVERAKNEMLTYVEEVEVIDFEAAKDRFKIRATPALIFIRDDIQGEELLTEDMESGKLRLALECYKALQEEEAVIHNAQTNRLDNVVKAEKQAAEDALLLDMLERGII